MTPSLTQSPSVIDLGCFSLFAESTASTAIRYRTAGDLAEVVSDSGPESLVGARMMDYFVIPVQSVITRVVASTASDSAANSVLLGFVNLACAEVASLLSLRSRGQDSLVARPLVSESGRDQIHLQNVEHIKRLSRLSDNEIADLLGVSRMTLYNWRKGTPPSKANRERALVIREILDTAANYQSLAVWDWLHTPRGTSGQAPLALMKAGGLVEARRLAIINAPMKPAPALPSDYRRSPQYIQAQQAKRALSNLGRDADELPIDDDV